MITDQCSSIKTLNFCEQIFDAFFYFTFSIFINWWKKFFFPNQCLLIFRKSHKVFLMPALTTSSLVIHYLHTNEIIIVYVFLGNLDSHPEVSWCENGFVRFQWNVCYTFNFWQPYSRMNWEKLFNLIMIIELICKNDNKIESGTILFLNKQFKFNY